MKSAEYEQFVADCLAEMLEKLFRNGGSQPLVHRRRKIVGRRSGHQHEIDLSFEIDIAGFQLLFIVECKAYNRPIGIDEVIEFAGRLDDIAAHKGIMVTTQGYQRGAIAFAKSKRIALIEASFGWWNPVLRSRPTKARYSERYFDLVAPRIVEIDRTLRLVLSPINMVDLDGITNIDSWPAVDLKNERAKTLHVLITVHEPGGVDGADGEIILYDGLPPNGSKTIG